MCGIVGIRRFDGVAIDPDRLRRMADQLVHRGPDDQGLWIEGPVGFGHRRLSIIDLAGSPQPMRAGSDTICFNGEIFNYQALRKELQAEGYSFRTDGDTEVLLALHRTAGVDGIHRANGQFAYAIWDGARSELVLHRDRLGILPLYYYWDGRVFAFASEIKALLPAIEGGPRVDDASLKEYLAYRSVPAPHTLFEGVRKLEPGGRIRLDATGRLRVESWWSLPTAAADESIPAEEAVELVERALEDAVSRRLVADVPVGAYLSGGVDSSLIVALMSRLKEGGRVETFSAGFGDPRFDELPYARQVSQSLGTVHHEVLVEPADFRALWHRLTWHRDAPISEPADLAIFRLASLARDHVKVLLSGEGSDELFAGYPKYRWATRAGLADWLPAGLRGRTFRLLERAAPARLAKARIALRAMSARSEADRFQAWFAPFTRYERDVLLPGVERDGHVAITARTEGDLVQRMLYADCHAWLVDNLLERGDRMAMAASVESRPPFLDHELVELAFRLPSNVKLRDGTTKWVVKEVARRRLPASIVDRRKVGFRVPLDAWFRGELREMANDLLLGAGSFVGGRMDRRFVASMLADHARGRRDEEIRIWTLLCLEVWHEVFFRNTRESEG
ncbi:MAG: asparagine synthase (glutamine-hydrolyzing) [Spirochaetaceae bacterium]|nr:asparagine synthase (glutamine-hydrolyzing) [Myxococcales bacterium]MCB9725347.1 asparagine synthase (glutamine-hydrolyzing) [Spirochaetaceae bacterium]